MKLHLPLFLLSGILSLHLTMTASADVIGNGVCYDLGKAYFSDDPDLESQLDKNYCWVAGASNIIQYWQDTYYEDYKDNDVFVPNGTNSAYGSPTGTMYLDVYQKAYKEGVPDQWGNYDSGYPRKFVEWWMKGTPTGELKNNRGYYTQSFSGKESAAGVFHVTYQQDDKIDMVCFGEDLQSFKGTVESKPDGSPGNNTERWAEMSEFIKDSFDVQGRALALEINTSHIITCWGYETNKDGLVTSLILSDSDDAAFGTFRAQISIGDTDATEFYDGFYGSFGERLMISTDDQSSLKYPIGPFRDEKAAVWLTAFTYVDTPVVAEKIAPDSSLVSGAAITSNVRLTENKTVEGGSIIVGDGKNAVVLTSESDKSVTLDGNQSNLTGMMVKEGAMASLSHVEISNYEQSGVESVGKTYFHDGEVSIHDNTTGENGGAVNNSNYLEFLNCEVVNIADNSADGKGGAISNTNGSTVSIRGNKEVVFSGNKAVDGANDIYNGAGSYLNIADNDSVTFNGTDGAASIVNEGDLYLRAESGKSINFNNSSLDSDKGTVYVGKDILYRDNNIEYFYVFDTNDNNGGKVTFKDSDGHTTSLQANPNDNAALSYATLEKLSVSANTIAGAGTGADSGVVRNALITSLGGLTMNNLNLDTTDTVNSLGSGFTNLDGVVLTLTNDDMVNNTFDLTNVFTGNLTLNNVVFDLSQTTLTEAALKGITFNLSKAYASLDQLDLYLKTAQGTVSFATAGSTVLLAISPLPEPTTGTLSLLALAGLAARRRRK